MSIPADHEYTYIIRGAAFLCADPAHLMLRPLCCRFATSRRAGWLSAPSHHTTLCALSSVGWLLQGRLGGGQVAHPGLSEQPAQGLRRAGADGRRPPMYVVYIMFQ